MSLQNELKMSVPFASPYQEAMLALTRTQRIIDKFGDQVFEEHSITNSQYNVLRILRGNPNALGMTCGDISSRMLYPDSDITRLVDKLVKLRYVVRSRCDKDRRKVLTQITPDGIALVQQLEPKLQDMMHFALGHVSESNMLTLIQILEEIRSKHI